MARTASASTATSAVVRELFEYMDSAQLSQRVVAERMGVTPDQLSLWRHGHRVPTAASVQKMADAMGLKIHLRRERP